MKRNLKVVFVCALTLGLFAPAAQAGYYLSRGVAERFARNLARERYSAQRPAASCRPQGRSAPERGYIYHRWVCGWAATTYDSDGYEMMCSGKVLILGSRDRSAFWWKVLAGERCE